MDGMQKTIVDALRYLANNVEDGRYGEDDDLAAEAFLEDLDEYVSNLFDG